MSVHSSAGTRKLEQGSRRRSPRLSIGEGFDDPRLDTLVLAMPIAWKGTMTQYAGRLHRHHDAKHEIRILDDVDHEIPVLRRMYAKRQRAYTNLGYRLPATG